MARPSVPKRWLRLTLSWLLVGPLSGCYYLQAVGGHVSLMQQREPIVELVASPETDAALRAQLESVSRAREFAITELGLPDNGSYQSYVALEHDYVVVNVFAAPEFSLTPRQWCYPFVGCVAYRGYFDASDAERYARRLGKQGLDVATSRVRAYSTLGRFRDPVLSTMLAGGAPAAARLIFHELAHQVVYVDDDTAFNESFASFVADEGWRRWAAAQSLAVAADRSTRRDALRRALAELREALEVLYDGAVPDTDKRRQKAVLFEAFAERWRELGARGKPPANNAELVPIALYDDLTGGFAALLAAEGGDLEAFYARVRSLAEVDAEARRRALDEARSAAR